MGHRLSCTGVPGDAAVDVGQDKSVLILIEHCRDMKRQEAHLRLVTLLLTLGCAALFLFITCSELRLGESCRSNERQSTSEQYPVSSRQEVLCPTAWDNPPTHSRGLYIHLRSVPSDSQSDEQYLRWNARFGERHVEEGRAVVIPEKGHYFIYVGVTLRCPDDKGKQYRNFKVTLHQRSQGYNENVTLEEAWETVPCASDGSHSLFLGQLFDLLRGDRVSVLVEEGYRLILKSSFGAYLA